ncbi:MAG TPA: PEPxxWA-CTERM sorting domain-containing protein [Caulobacteraceae bacterium]|nr:PEPxxWA-CTERM sorting domain-containing protein [Caulobacteraceae bacterium]
MRPTSALAAITLALSGVGLTSGAAAAEVVSFIPGTYSLAQSNLGPAVDTLDLTVSSGVATFVLTGLDNATFSVPEMSTPAGGGTTNPYYMVDGTHVTGSWDKTIFPFITFWSTPLQGGFTIGSQPGESGRNVVDVFQSTQGTGQVFAFGVVAQSIPEPATWAMVLLGVGLIGGGLRLNARGKEVSSAA